jgi:hypothetical protein
LYWFENTDSIVFRPAMNKGIHQLCLSRLVREAWSPDRRTKFPIFANDGLSLVVVKPETSPD